jgi:putative oxidoreductase
LYLQARTFQKEVLKVEDIALLILRLVLGGIFVAHGAQKLFGSFGGYGLKGTAGFFEQIGLKPGRTMALLAGLAEFSGGLLVLVGFLTPLGAFALIAVQAVAIARVHAPNGFFNESGGYEFNLVLVAVAGALILIGSGAYGLDAALEIL